MHSGLIFLIWRFLHRRLHHLQELKLFTEGFLSPYSKALCVEALAGEDVLALKENGVANSIGVSKTASPPLIVSGSNTRSLNHLLILSSRV
ncbi:hypothetical protein ACFX2I_023326 [Malus domestica]